MRTQFQMKRVSRLLTLVAMAVGLAWLFAACGAAANTGPVHDVASLQAHLRAQGARAELAGAVKHPFFVVAGQIMVVNGQDIEVFQYADAKALAADTRNVGPDGCIGTVGGGMLDAWVAPPHFYKSEGVMVIYLGSDAKMLQLLTSVMGKQFAGA